MNRLDGDSPCTKRMSPAFRFSTRSAISTSRIINLPIALIGSDALHIFIPLKGKQILFLIVAFFTADHNIYSLGFSAARNGNLVVHGQLIGRQFPSAVIAYAGGHLP